MQDNNDLEKQLAELPSGYITHRTINNKTYYYHQGTKNGQQFSFSVSEKEAEELEKNIELRKSLEKKLKMQGIKSAVKKTESSLTAANFNTSVSFGKTLRTSIQQAARFQKRDCYATIEKYLYSETIDKVCVIYGLRRTGKTTLLRQLMLSFSEENFSKTAYIKCQTSDTIANLNKDIILLQEKGFKYLFIDEVTLINDFIDSSSLFSDVFAAQGMKIVLSGTDSLGFNFAINDELYDRAVMVHTTFIPYKEHSRLLGINDIDDYIRYGGTLKAGEIDFESKEINAKDASFRDDESTRYYIDTAICSNIQHSLECFKDGRYFRHLKTLYEADELTNAINRIIESMNHDFAVKIITQEFKSNDLRSAAQMLRSAKEDSKRTNILDTIDTSFVLERLKNILSIKEKDQQTIGITPVHTEEIKEYLAALDLIEKINIETRFADKPQLNASESYYIFSQPGMRFCQAQALVYSLMNDPQLADIDVTTRKLISDKIFDDVRGRMLEDIVLLETKKSLEKNWKNQKKVFKLRFQSGEYDMVISDFENSTCQIFEIKHSAEIVPNQYKNLVNTEMTSLTEKFFGKITGKTVIYKGPDKTTENGIEYKNAEEYLCGLEL